MPSGKCSYILRRMIFHVKQICVPDLWLFINFEEAHLTSDQDLTRKISNCVFITEAGALVTNTAQLASDYVTYINK